MKKNSSSDPTDDPAPSRGKWRTFVKRAMITFFVLSLGLIITLILCRKPIAARVIEQQLLASGFSRAEVVIEIFGTESIGGTIKGDTTIAGEFAEGQLTFLIRCPKQELLDRTFQKLEITLSDAAVLIDPTVTVPESAARPSVSPDSTPSSTTPDSTLREKLADIHSRISWFHLKSPIRIGIRMPDQSVTTCMVRMRDKTYVHGDKLRIRSFGVRSPKIDTVTDLLAIPEDPEEPHEKTYSFKILSDLNFAPEDTISTEISVFENQRFSIPFLPEPWSDYHPSLRQCDVHTIFRWADDGSLELVNIAIFAHMLSLNHPIHGKFDVENALYAQSEHYKSLEISSAHGIIHLPSGATITLPETSPLTARAIANYRDENLDHLTASLSSDVWIYNHGTPMGSIDLGDIAITNLRATADYRDHTSPWQRRAFITLRANTYGAAINSVGTFLTDLNTTDPVRALGSIAFSDLPLETVDLPDALAPVLVEYELAGNINGQLALGIDSAKPDPLTTLSLTANGTALGIKHREDPIHISGGDLTIHFPDLRIPTTLQDQRFSIAKADAGSIHAKDITGKMSLDAESNLLLREVKGTSFGGTIRLNKATIPADDSPYTLDLLFENVDAADLVALYPDFKGTITGELSGRVPIVFGSKTLPRAGKLQLDKDSISTLRYDASDLFSTDSDRDKIIRTALADLNVTTLDVFIFDPTRPKGEINIVIGGVSNKLFNGAPVPLEAFNLNMDLSEAEEFIFDLLTSIDGLSFE